MSNDSTSDDDFLLTASERRAKKQRKQLHYKNNDNNNNNHDTINPHIPGYYYDNETNKYYRISDQMPNKLKLAAKQQNIKIEQHKKQRNNDNNNKTVNNNHAYKQVKHNVKSLHTITDIYNTTRWHSLYNTYVRKYDDKYYKYNDISTYLNHVAHNILHVDDDNIELLYSRYIRSDAGIIYNNNNNILGVCGNYGDLSHIDSKLYLYKLHNNKHYNHTIDNDDNNSDAQHNNNYSNICNNLHFTLEPIKNNNTVYNWFQTSWLPHKVTSINVYNNNNNTTYISGTTSTTSYNHDIQNDKFHIVKLQHNHDNTYDQTYQYYDVSKTIYSHSLNQYNQYNTILLGCNKSAIYYDIQHNNQLCTIRTQHNTDVLACNWLNTNTCILGTRSNNVQLYDIRTKQQNNHKFIATASSKHNIGFNTSIASIKPLYNYDNNYVVTSLADSSVHLIDLRMNNVVYTYNNDINENSYNIFEPCIPTLNNDHTLLYTTNQNNYTIQVYDMMTCKLLHSIDIDPLTVSVRYMCYINKHNTLLLGHKQSLSAITIQ